MQRSSLVTCSVVVGLAALVTGVACDDDTTQVASPDATVTVVQDAFIPDASIPVPIDAGPAVGLGANLQCASMPANAFTTYGSAAFIAVNAQIFKEVAAETQAHGATNLGSSFSEVGSAGHDSLATFEGQLASYLEFTYGGPSSIVFTDGLTYSGADQNIEEEHRGLAITSSQYDYFVTNIVVPSLAAKGVTADDITACFAPPLMNATFEASIVGH